MAAKQKEKHSTKKLTRTGKTRRVLTEVVRVSGKPFTNGPITISMPTAFVLLSGGIDSTTCLYLAKKEFAHVRAISIDYGQRHKKEMHYARKTCKALGIKHEIIKIPNVVPETMLTDKKREVPHTSYAEIKGVSPTYVPFRNGLMLSVIASYVHGTLLNEGKEKPNMFGNQPGDENAIYFGAHAEDARGWAYPDCTPEFIGAMANAVYIGTYNRVRLHTPLQWLNKQQIIQLGSNLQVDWKKTWSCYKGEKLHCGKCPTCLARKQGFKDAWQDDPTEYEAC